MRYPSRIFSSLLIAACIFSSSYLSAAKVGLLVMATGKYIKFIDPLVTSARKHFCKGHNVTYYVFTDGDLPKASDIVRIQQGRLGWPYDTMKRYHVYLAHKDLLSKEDYLFACDADMLFVGDVGDEILSDRVATLHPYFLNRRGTYDANPSSKAYVKPTEGKHYFCGGFYGGSSKEFLNILKTCAERVDEDAKNGVIALWHDESHWNRYCIDTPPTKILSEKYCCPEDLKNSESKLLALIKNHGEMRK